MPVSKYFEADVTLLGFMILHVGFLVVKDPNTLLEPQHSTQLPGVIGCNLIHLGCEEFGKVYGFEAFEEFWCLPNLHPVVFAQMCSFYHHGKLSEQPQTLSANQIHSGQININTSEISSEVRNQDLSQESVLSQVWVGNPQQAICIPANSMKVVQGRTNRITRRLSCMVEARACNNLPRGVVVNRTMFTPNKNKWVPISLVNTNTYNVWICLTLLAADVVEAEDCPWDYQSIMSHDGSDIKVSFCPMPSSEVQTEILTQGVRNAGPDTTNQHEEGKRPQFGPWPNFNDPDFDFEKELSQLPFPVNMGEVNMNELQQKQFLELIYDNQSVFSLCDEDFGLSDRLKHTIPMTTDRPIYFPHQYDTSPTTGWGSQVPWHLA